MKSRLSNSKIQCLKTLVISKGIDPKVIDEAHFYSKTSSNDFKDVLRWFGIYWFNATLPEHEKLKVEIQFEPHPLSELDTQIGLFYVDSVLGFDTYSRRWHIGDVATWREEAQKAAFEDNWNRWIQCDFTSEIQNVFSIKIDESINALGIRQLFDLACRRAKYRCPIVEPGKDCYCNIEIIVEEIGYEDVDDHLFFDDNEKIDYTIQFFSVEAAKRFIAEQILGFPSYGMEVWTGCDNYTGPGREPEVHVWFDVPRNLESRFRRFYSALEVGISVKRDGEEIARAIPPRNPEEHRLWCELSQDAYDELVGND